MRCKECESVVKYNPECYQQYQLCILCAIKKYPSNYTKRQKLKQKRRIMATMNDITSIIEKTERFEILLYRNKPVKEWHDWNKVTPEYYTFFLIYDKLGVMG